eukprot:CAMPEP_0171569692 /NCGR_PEP_ID=MMETSP0961-20121227/2501_1 /TAXON_ID=87120 /ORGANISM="Aurantiochytrium limacinum, Strain ATCCMYA-1381" /LENGTH=431 /DNA_ID=CAMNT_0012124041 /DNA_START=351 /DNA_END=1645 /DNA_ORIENTATION=+
MDPADYTHAWNKDICGHNVEKGMRKENQDTVHIALYPDDDDESGCALICAVLDGHGTSGRICALKTREFFAQELAAVDNSIVTSCLEGDLETLSSTSKDLFERAQTFVMDIADEKTKRIFARFSGTTVTIAIVAGPYLCLLNVGDSEATLGQIKSSDDSAPKDGELVKSGEESTQAIKSFMLSTKHQLHLPEERERIIEAGGRIAAKRGNDEGPLRVWLPDVETPGLMVSRSIGDGVCHDLGVSAEPSVFLKLLEPCDKFVILASDGLWEFVECQDAVEVVEDYIDPDDASHAARYYRPYSMLLLETLDERRDRLSSQPDFEERHKKRLAEMQKLEEQIRAQKQEAIDAIKNNLNGGFAGNPANGSILFGDPSENAFGGGGGGGGSNGGSAIPTLDAGGLTSVSVPSKQPNSFNAADSGRSQKKSSMCIIS